MRKRRIGVAAVAASVALYAASPVLACGIDGIPSLSGNGALAHRNTQRATYGTLGRWAPFVFVAPYRTGQTVTFRENVADLRKSLLPQAFGHPWQWRFGDGTTTNGDTVHHAYKRAGVYKMVVYAYYSSYKQWYEFDSALLHVR
ncbi:MAG TPA: PKD domain-containing protein [Chloroflexota bacterium]|nr:PKD domain-containing protein [Chloroflexota bacterium]